MPQISLNWMGLLILAFCLCVGIWMLFRWEQGRPLLTRGLIKEKGERWAFWYKVKSWAVPISLAVFLCTVATVLHVMPVFQKIN